MIAKKITKTEWVDALLSDDYATWSRMGAEFLHDYYLDLALEFGETFYLDRAWIREVWSEYDVMDRALEDFPSLEDREHYVLDNGHVLVDTSY